MNGFASYSGYSGIERRRRRVLPYFGGERRTSVANSHVLNEAFLLQRAAAGDREAFVRLYDRFVDQVFRYTYYNVGQRAVAEQLTARVFMSAWREIQQNASAKLSFSTWLYRLAHDVIADYRAVPTPPSPGGDTREEPKPLLQKGTAGALAQLPDEQRLVLILRFVVGQDTEQVAEILGKQPATIRTLQHRALSGLGAILRKGAEK